MLSSQEIGSPQAGPASGEKLTPGGVDQVGATATHAKSDEERWKRHTYANKLWRERNKEKIAAYQREYQRKWKEDNKDRLRAYRRKAKHGESPSSLQALLASQRGLCKLCGGDLTKARHLDHIVPRSRGGKSEMSNYQYLCPTCNMAKGAQSSEEFLEHIKRILLYNGKWYE